MIEVEYTLTCDAQGCTARETWVPDGVNDGPEGWHFWAPPEAAWLDDVEDEVYCEEHWDHEVQEPIFVMDCNLCGGECERPEMHWRNDFGK